MTNFNKELTRAIEDASKWTTPDGKPSLRIMTELAGGDHLVLPDGRRIERRFEWIEIPDEPRAAYYAGLHLLRLVAKHGPGAVWFLGQPVHMIDANDGVFVLPGPDGGGCARVRTIYYHEAHAA